MNGARKAQFWSSFNPTWPTVPSLSSCRCKVAPCTCGVPHSSILGLLFFLRYILPLGQILSKHHISFHCFVINIQLYIHFKLSEQSALQPLLDCLVDIKSWMGAYSLKLNKAKIEIMVFEKSSKVFLTNARGPGSSNMRPSVRDLGVIFNSALKFQE